MLVYFLLNIRRPNSVGVILNASVESGSLTLVCIKSKMQSCVEDYEVLYTIGSGSYGRCQKIRRKSDGKVSSQHKPTGNVKRPVSVSDCVIMDDSVKTCTVQVYCVELASKEIHLNSFVNRLTSEYVTLGNLNRLHL